MNFNFSLIRSNRMYVLTDKPAATCFEISQFITLMDTMFYKLSVLLLNCVNKQISEQ